MSVNYKRQLLLSFFDFYSHNGYNIGNLDEEGL